jgi:hypothetical protein
MLTACVLHLTYYSCPKISIHHLENFINIVVWWEMSMLPLITNTNYD